MRFTDSVHGAFIANRRVRVLRRHLAPLLPPEARVLDVGCGDGLLARLIQEERPDVRLQGIDVLARENALIPVTTFDGRKIPYNDGAFHVVLFVDVLHHAEDPMLLLREAMRVSSRTLIIKDHTADGLLAHPTLRFMDRVGNARYGVALPYNYWTEARWRQAFRELQLNPVVWTRHLGLYPPPADWVFGRGLHFIACLECSAMQPRSLSPLR